MRPVPRLAPKGQFAVELGVPVLDEDRALAFLAETLGFETVDHRRRKPS
jgi:hypothetical protein